MAGQYPMPRPAADHRFTYGLMFDVAELLEERGFPPIRGDDLARLLLALHDFLYTAPGTTED